MDNTALPERITSVSNSRVKRLRLLGQKHEARREEGEYLLEGKRLFEDALCSGSEISEVFILEDLYNSYEEEIASRGIKAFLASEAVIGAVSGVKSPQGVVFTVKSPETANPSRFFNPTGSYILLDRLSDPGNLGTILRSADAFGMDGLVLSPGCADVYAPKVVRAGMGAHFRVELCHTELAEAIEELHGLGIRVYAACAAQSPEKERDGERLYLGAGDLAERFAAVIGNEAEGVGRGVIAACDGTVTIPMGGKAESLNAAVAASILMWEMSKQALEKDGHFDE